MKTEWKRPSVAALKSFSAKLHDVRIHKDLKEFKIRKTTTMAGGGVHEKPVKHKTALHETASLLESSVLLLLCLLELRQEGPDLAEQLELPAALVGPVLRRGRSLPDEPEEPEEAAET